MNILGKETLGWKIKYMIWSPFWVLFHSDESKSWSEYKYGMMKHECDYSHWKLAKESDHNYKFYKCKHHGCNIVQGEGFMPGGEYYERARLQPVLKELYHTWRDHLDSESVNLYTHTNKYIKRENDSYSVEGKRDVDNKYDAVEIRLNRDNHRFSLTYSKIGDDRYDMSGWSHLYNELGAEEALKITKELIT